MTAFIDWLESAAARDTRVRAVLRRNLAFEPATYPPAFPYVEPFLRDEDSTWRRSVHYLVAALWALHWRQGRVGPPLSIGEAIAHRARQQHSRDQLDKGDSSTERRFVALLDADADQLAHRLRQVVALLADETLDFKALLTDLLGWRDPRKLRQQQWARDFYRTLGAGTAADTPDTPSAKPSESEANTQGEAA